MNLFSFNARRFAFLFGFAAIAGSLVAGETVMAAPAPTQPVTKPQSVAIRGMAFVPQVITVAPGTTIIWTNADDDPHTVFANDKSFHSAALDTNDRYSFTFTKPGEFAYFCSVHPHMTGKIIVKG